MDVRVGFWMGEWDAGRGLTQCALAILQGCHDHFWLLALYGCIQEKKVDREPESFMDHSPTQQGVAANRLEASFHVESEVYSVYGRTGMDDCIMTPLRGLLQHKRLSVSIDGHPSPLFPLLTIGGFSARNFFPGVPSKYDLAMFEKSHPQT